MKANTLMAMLMLLAAVGFATSCKKDSPVDEENKTVQLMQQKILGRWNLVEFIEETKKDNEPAVIIDNDPENIYFEFLANGRVKTNAEGRMNFLMKSRQIIYWCCGRMNKPLSS